MHSAASFHSALAKSAERGLQNLELDIATAPGSELLFETTAGPAGNWSFDWAALGPFTLRPLP